ncbi:unnamed protein product [Toxocara canis]|uniref:PA domain-containing protein n=1 Tax=Toxocara canis TaxID=6265 RepID=A0A183VCN4_TOXCA|nr:unnamed protein product [Toxocara canis]
MQLKKRTHEHIPTRQSLWLVEIVFLLCIFAVVEPKSVLSKSIENLWLRRHVLPGDADKAFSVLSRSICGCKAKEVGESAMRSASTASSLESAQTHIIVERKVSKIGHFFALTHIYEMCHLKFGDARFRIVDERIITSSAHVKKLITAGKCPVVINLDHLKGGQPCLTSGGIASAIDYANGRAVIAVSKILESLAAANALQMWELRTAISEELARLASIPQCAPFAIGIAAVNVTSEWRKIIFEHAYQILEDVVIQPTITTLSFSSLKLYIKFIMEKARFRRKFPESG